MTSRIQEIIGNTVSRIDAHGVHFCVFGIEFVT